MRRAVFPVALLIALSTSALALAVPGATAQTDAGILTPIVVTALSDEPVVAALGTDNALHVVYELQLVNPQPVALPVTNVEVHTTSPNARFATFAGDDLTARLRHLDGTAVDAGVIDPGASLFLLVDFTLPSANELPDILEHHVTVGDRGFVAAPVSVAPRRPTVLAPPVAGTSWVVTDGCCGPDAPHRDAILSTSVGFTVPTRYAVDLRQMDEQGRFVVDDPTQASNYPGYGTFVFAVAPGQVVAAVDQFPEQVPGTAPPPGTFDAEHNEGNSVVIRLRNGAYASYGQLQAGSVLVEPGAHVRRGQPIAKLGNSGNSSAPHLHFQLMSGPSVAADGLPFVLGAFGYAGQIDAARLTEQGLTGAYADNRLPAAQTRQRQLPLDLAILDFDASSGTSGSPLV
jgi:hypothetical protein